ncbi:hypothetical protein BDW75DRAFT_235613 [Aspergillus navahoensis]
MNDDKGSEIYIEDLDVQQRVAPPATIEEKHIVRRIDIRLLPILGLLYTISLIDRGNIAVARIAGLDADTGIAEGNRYSIVLLVYYIGYVIFEIPSNIVIREVGARNWLAAIGAAWGLIMLGMGFVHSWQSLAVLRAFLGVLEAGLFPGCIYLISSWYTRYEVQRRLGLFYITAIGLNAFGNILAYGLIQISRHTRYKGWRWIFIIEGCLTVAIAVLTWFVLVDFPHSANNSFLSDDQKRLIHARLAQDRGSEEGEKVTWKAVGRSLRDWKVWSFAFIYMGGAVGLSSLLFFIPLILSDGLKFGVEGAYLLSAPPQVLAAIVGYATSWLADRVRRRGPFVIIGSIVAIVGLCMTGFLDSSASRYVGVFLGYSGATVCIISSITWQQNNIRGDVKRAVGSGLQIMVGGVGGVYASLVFRSQDAPNYIPGLVATIAVFALGVFLAIITSFILWQENKKADQGGIDCEGLEGFRYTL